MEKFTIKIYLNTYLLKQTLISYSWLWNSLIVLSILPVSFFRIEERNVPFIDPCMLLLITYWSKDKIIAICCFAHHKLQATSSRSTQLQQLEAEISTHNCSRYRYSWFTTSFKKGFFFFFCPAMRSMVS